MLPNPNNDIRDQEKAISFQTVNNCIFEFIMLVTVPGLLHT